MSWVIVSNNIPGRATPADVKAYFKRWYLRRVKTSKPAPSIINTQEFYRWRALFLEIMGPRWRMVSTHPGQPFAWDTREWNYKSNDGFVAIETEFVGSAGAGPAKIGPYYVQWLHLQRKATIFRGTNLMLFNLHAPASIQVRKQPGAQRSRREIHADLMQQVAVRADAVKYPVIITGDFNCQWEDRNLDVFREKGFRLANSDEWTLAKGKRRIDLILYRDGKVTTYRDRLGRFVRVLRRKLQRVSAGVFTTVVDDEDRDKLLDDDHRGVWAEFRFVR